MKTINNAKGFTLLEILVTILIIGVLASFGVVEYQKAIEHSRASQAIALLRSLYHAEKVHQLQHGTFADSLDQLDFSFQGDPVTCAQNNNSPCFGYYNTEAIQNGNWSIELEKGKNPSISVGRISGPYAGSGFFMQLERKDGIQYPLEQLACIENNSGKFKYKKKEGSYCVDIMDGEFYSKSGTSRKYELAF
ncbi:type IV pilin protein [Candidatus Avelusimicrobium luingense]|uniref:type IV pilin protein n=1 Tax=Candidatus Avelusimicrobium luingense TaxID=3416211 RepID=UPI003D0EE4DA